MDLDKRFTSLIQAAANASGEHDPSDLVRMQHLHCCWPALQSACTAPK